MKNRFYAKLFPLDKTEKPIVINWNGSNVIKPTNIFINICRQKPNYFKQIVFFYKENDLLYLKPFNL